MNYASASKVVAIATHAHYNFLFFQENRNLTATLNHATNLRIKLLEETRVRHGLLQFICGTHTFSLENCVKDHVLLKLLGRFTENCTLLTGDA
jgi:hypothetical protein